MNELYVEMMREHPIQSIWKKDYELVGADIFYDGRITQHLDTFNFKHDEALWIPRQENWQEIYNTATGSYVSVKILNEWKLKNQDQWTMITTTSHTEYWNLTWCLFVSREVYNLEWDCEEKKWMKLK